MIINKSALFSLAVSALSVTTLSSAMANDDIVPAPATGIYVEQYPGFTLPEDRKMMTCSISKDRVIMKSRSIQTPSGGWALKISSDMTTRKRDWKKISRLLQEAATGNVKKSPYPCDAGTDAVTGSIDGKAFAIKVNADCDGTYTNESKAAAQLKAYAEKLCGFKFRRF